MVSLTFRPLSQLIPIENNIGWAPDPVSAFWCREKSLASTWNRIPDISAHILVTRRLNSLLGLLDHWRLKALPSSETSENQSTAISGNNTQPWRNSRKPSPQKLTNLCLDMIFNLRFQSNQQIRKMVWTDQKTSDHQSTSNQIKSVCSLCAFLATNFNCVRVFCI